MHCHGPLSSFKFLIYKFHDNYFNFIFLSYFSVHLSYLLQFFKRTLNFHQIYIFLQNTLYFGKLKKVKKESKRPVFEG